MESLLIDVRAWLKGTSILLQGATGLSGLFPVALAAAGLTAATDFLGLTNQ
jgi:hypothetical protein